MSEFDSEILATVAYAEVHAGYTQFGPVLPTYVANRGFTPSIIVGGADGDYTHTLEPGRGLDNDVMGIFVSSLGVLPGNPGVPLIAVADRINANQIQVRLFDNSGGGTHGGYCIKVIRTTNSFS